MIAKCKICKNEYLGTKVNDEYYAFDIAKFNDCCTIENLEFASGTRNVVHVEQKKNKCIH